MTKTILIQPDNSIEVKEFDANDYPTLRAEVGGPIELVYAENDITAHCYIHEEGKWEGLPFNAIATMLTGLLPDDVVVGPAVFMGSDNEGNEADIPSGWTAVIREPRDCDICRSQPRDGAAKQAAVDGKTVFGPWANMCGDHFAEVGVGLGVGLGQVYQIVPYE